MSIDEVAEQQDHHQQGDEEDPLVGIALQPEFLDVLKEDGAAVPELLGVGRFH